MNDRRIEVLVQRTTTVSSDYGHQRHLSCDSVASDFSCSNVINRQSHAYVEPPTYFTLILKEVLCVPHYPNHLLIGETASYYPRNSITPLTAIVKKISGLGHHRDVTIECCLSHNQHVIHGLERGVLVFAPNLDNDQPIDYSPPTFHTILLAIWGFVIYSWVWIQEKRRTRNRWTVVEQRQHKDSIV
jgi:hypothetical protein